ncbi:MAG: elongation factor P [Patescibacteria group bacterium]
MASVSEIKKGMVIRWKGDLWAIGEFQHVSPGKGSAFTRIRLKNLANGKTVENTFKATESLEFADVVRRNMSFLFSDTIAHTFMDTNTYEQVAASRDAVGDDGKYLKEGVEVIISLHEDAPVAIELPKKIEYTIVQTEPAVKGDTASGNVQKDATLDNGLVVRVPIFLKEGDRIMVNTGTGEYVERVNG